MSEETPKQIPNEMLPRFVVKDWDNHYENNRSRVLKTMRWVMVSNDTGSCGYSQLLSEPSGPTYFAVWIVVLQIASKCDPRGELVRRNGQPHDCMSISLISRISANDVASAIKHLKNIGWMAIKRPADSTDGTQGSVDGQSSVTEASLEGHTNRIEGKGIERERDAGAGDESEPQETPPPAPPPLPKPPERPERADDDTPPSELTLAARKMYDELKDIGSLSTIEYKHVYEACRSYPKVDLALATDTISVDADNMVNHINEPFSWLRRQLARIDQFVEKGDCRPPQKKEIGRIDGGDG